MNKIIKNVLESLETNGFEAYLVGGYVRDTLLGIETFDIDICTNALPKELYNMFNIIANNYGGVKLKIDKYNIDITTFRKDKNYVNCHPTEVIYISSLQEDLKRRDFTINAICMDKNGAIIDLINGVKDLDKRVIKSIGDPERKMQEDPLRMLRAIRFATVLNFEIDESLMLAIKNNFYLISNISKKKIKNELDKILLSKNFLKGLSIMKDCNILKTLNISYNDINYVEDLAGMWAQIKVVDMPFTNKEKSNIIKIAEIISGGKIDSTVLYKYGLYISTIAGLILNISPKYVNKLYKKMPIKSRNDIAIKSSEIIELLGIVPSKEVGLIYQDLSEKILNGVMKNKKNVIEDYLLRRK